MDPQPQSAPEARAYRILREVFGDLMRAAGALEIVQEASPEVERAAHLAAIRAAITVLSRLVGPLSGPEPTRVAKGPRRRKGCGPCNTLAATLRRVGLAHWQRQEHPPGRHYMMTPAAIRAQPVGEAEDRVADLRKQLGDIEATGWVAWVDVSPQGDFVVYQAPHGLIPLEIPGQKK